MIGQGGGNGFQLRQGASRLGSRKKFCTQRLGMHWNSLPEEVVDAPSLEAFKPRLDVALGSPLQWLATLHVAGGLKLHDHGGPFQPRPFYDPIIVFTLNVSRTMFPSVTAHSTPAERRSS